MLSHDTILAPDRTYPWYARWTGARPAKETISKALRTLPNLGEPGKTYSVAVISGVSDTTANGVIWPLGPLPVSSVVFELARLGADSAGVDEWPEGIKAAMAKAYWDKIVGNGIEANEAYDSMEDGVATILRTTLLALGIGAGLYFGIVASR